MNNRITFLFIIGIGLIWLGPNQAWSKIKKPLSHTESIPSEISLNEALELALKRNPDVILAELNQKIFETQYWQAVGLAFPEINLSGTWTTNFKRPSIVFGDETIQIGKYRTLELNATATQPLYTGGKVGTAVKAARKQREVGEAESAGVRETILLGVKQLFYGTLLAEQLAGIQDDNLKSTEEHLNTIKERYRQGLDSDLIVRRQEVEVANAKTLVLIARNYKDNMLTDLQDILALDVDKPLRLNGALKPVRGVAPDYESYVQKAMDQRPELMAARKRTQVAWDLVKITKGDMLPTLALFGRYSWTAEYDNWPASENERYSTILGGLQLKHQLFAGGRNWQQVNEAKLKYDQALEEETRVERSVRIDVKKKWLSVVEALERSKVEEAAIDAAEKALRATEIRYQEGQASQLELTDARLALNRVRTIYSQATYDYWVSLAGLERAAGIIPEELQP